MKRALLSSYTKDEALLSLARLLERHDWSLWGSAGSAKYLSDNHIPCRDIAELIGPPILEHRVVSLSRKLYAALLTLSPKDLEVLDRLGIRPIGLVYVTLYPLEEATANPKIKPEEVIDKTDIGGPTLLRAAAKGGRIVISDPSQIDMVASWLDNGATEYERARMVAKLRAAAERRVADYVDASARYWESQVNR